MRCSASPEPAHPNSAFGEETVKALDAELLGPAHVTDGQLLPKEAWLVSLVRSELAQGRKTIIYRSDLHKLNVCAILPLKSDIHGVEGS